MQAERDMRDTGHVTTREPGVMPGAAPPEAPGHSKDPPQGLRGVHGPAGTLISDLGSPELNRVDLSYLSPAPSHPAPPPLSRAFPRTWHNTACFLRVPC